MSSVSSLTISFRLPGTIPLRNLTHLGPSTNNMNVITRTVSNAKTLLPTADNVVKAFPPILCALDPS